MDETRRKYEEVKDGQWLGVSVNSQTQSNRSPAVVVSPLPQRNKLTNKQTRQRLVCLINSLKLVEVLIFFFYSEIVHHYPLWGISLNHKRCQCNSVTLVVFAWFLAPSAGQTVAN